MGTDKLDRVLHGYRVALVVSYLFFCKRCMLLLLLLLLVLF